MTKVLSNSQQLTRKAIHAKKKKYKTTYRRLSKGGGESEADGESKIISDSGGG